MGAGMGKYAGGIGKDKFRRSLRPDERIKPPKFMGKFMRHDWYWGQAKFPLMFLGMYVIGNVYNDNYTDVAIDHTIHKDFYDRNRRLSQLKGDSSENLDDRAYLLELGLKKSIT